MSDKFYFRLVLGVSLVVVLLVVVLNRQWLPRPDETPAFVPFLPKLNAIINAVCSVLLITSYYFIKKKQIEIHKRINITTFLFSGLFLISYVIYHYFGNETKFPADHPLRPVYLMVLLTHILLAAVVLPLVLLSFYYGLKMNVKAHRRLVRWTFPIWLYVTVSGVLVYLMISPYYTF